MKSMNGKILVAFASKHGATAGIAQAIGEELSDMGLTVDVRPVREVQTLDEYRAVIVGSALYMSGWQSDAREFVKHFERKLAARPTWLFSSGPTGGSAEADAAVARAEASPDAVPAPKEVAKWGSRIGARGHATFPGKVGPGVGGFFERWVPKGDWRDFDAIKSWAHGIGTDLSQAAAPATQ